MYLNLDLVKQYMGEWYAADMVSIAGLNAWMTPYTRSSTTEGRNRANAQPEFSSIVLH